MLRFLTKWWLKRPRWLLAVVVLAAFGISLEVLAPVFTGGLIGALAGRQEPLIATAVFLFLGVNALILINRAAMVYFYSNMQASNVAAIQNSAFEGSLHLDSEEVVRRTSALIVEQIRRAGWSYNTLTEAVLGSGMPQVLTALIVLALLGARWPLAAALCAVIASLVVCIGVIGNQKWVVRRKREVANYQDGIATELSDFLVCISVVRDFGREDDERQRLAGLIYNRRASAIAADQGSALLAATQGLLLGALLVIVTGWFVLNSEGGANVAGEIAFGISAFLLLSVLLRSIVNHIQNAMSESALLAGLMDLLHTEPTIRDAPSAVDLNAWRMLSISFDGVSFSYEQGRRVIEALSFQVKPGEKVALVGSTGSGKSTVVKLLQRLYDVDGGAVRIDGIDVRQIAQASLRRAVALVPQDAVLFHRSIAENIGYGKKGATLEEIRAAAKLARAHEFISELPQGYDTVVGERGVKLSGGERQRIAIARAFIANPPILILDEATSSLDTLTERLIQEAVQELLAVRTAIVIAHRLSTIRNVDRILVMERGCIIEQGTHDDLLSRGGRYAELINAQSVISE